ncbi:MAG: CvpA family protein [Clostridia bacterium]|nr:CvpA family protein [Clostridia bacterium]
MKIIDYIIIGLAAFLLIRGLFKGFLGQMFGVIGVVLVSIVTANVYQFPMQWMQNLIKDDNTRQAVALIATGVVVFLLYKLLTMLITKQVTKSKSLGVLNRIIGMLLGVALVYGVMAIIVALLFGTADTFLPLVKGLIKGPFEDSWIVNNVYKNNFFGDWVIKMVVEKIQSAIPPTV